MSFVTKTVSDLSPEYLREKFRIADISVRCHAPTSSVVSASVEFVPRSGSDAVVDDEWSILSGLKLCEAIVNGNGRILAEFEMP
jgi:hypothetical protein